MHFALAREMVESLELWLANMAQWKIQVKSILKWAKSKASSVFWLARIPLRELHLAAAAEKMHSRNHRSPTPALGKKIRKNSEEIHTNNGGVVVLHNTLSFGSKSNITGERWILRLIFWWLAEPRRGEEQCERDGSILYAAANNMCSHYSLSTP